MSIELFFSIKETDRFNDQIRITPGIGYKFSDKWRCELSISYHKTRNTTEDNDATNDYVFRFRLFKSDVKKGLLIKNKEEEIMDLIE